MDVILGEDETRPANRMALICSHCRLVNGQAPPGVKRLEEVGRWRCAECHQWNGKENVVQQILQDVKKEDAVVKADSARASAEEMTEKRVLRAGYDGTADEDVFTDQERSPEPPSILQDAEEEDEEIEEDDEDEEDSASPPPKTAPKRGRKRD